MYDLTVAANCDEIKDAGLQARLMSQALRKLTPVISKSNCIVIFINQLREKVGVTRLLNLQKAYEQLPR